VPDRTADLLIRVAEFLRKLPADQLDALASGEAKLEVVNKSPRATKSAALAVDAARVEADLRALPDRASALQYLKDLKLTKQSAAELARRLNVPVTTKDTGPVVLNKIVEQKVGFRLDSDAIYARR
jgi:hypothetical protein